MNFKLAELEELFKKIQDIINYIENSNASNSYIVKEAENVILNYIAKIESKKNIDRNYKRMRKYKFLQISNIVLIIITLIAILIK